AARDFDNDLNYQRAQLLAVDTATGALREVVTAKGAWSQPTVSPDGKWLAFTGYPESRKTHTVSDLYVSPIGGGEIRKLTGGLERDPI
ncbi:hypothetical protein ABTL95_19945, partial [Acinetobacter baumannii]